MMNGRTETPGTKVVDPVGWEFRTADQTRAVRLNFRPFCARRPGSDGWGAQDRPQDHKTALQSLLAPAATLSSVSS
jgi:hypothetical protein